MLLFKLSTRWLTGAAFALPLALLTFALAQAQTAPTVAAGAKPDCQSCHPAVQNAWADSAHSAPAGMLTQDNSAITCQTCHTTVSAAHPEAPMPVDRAAELCSECHRETYGQWQASEHGQFDLQCVTCHTPHSAQLKAANINALCATCHGSEATTFAHTTHATQDIDCADCHLPVGQTSDQAHATNTHLFAPSLAACTACHAAEAHTEAITVTATLAPTPVISSLNSGQPTTVAPTPTPVSPVGYAAFAGLLGLAFGIILAPWLERGFQRFTHNTPKEVRL